MIRVVVRVGVEAAEPQVRTDRHPTLEREHRQLRLTAQGAFIVSVDSPVPLLLLDLVLRGNRIRVRVQPLRRKCRAVERAVAHVARQQRGLRHETLRRLRLLRFQRRPVLVAEHPRAAVPPRRRVGDATQQVRIVNAGEPSDARGRGEPPETQVRHGQCWRVVRSEQRSRRGVSLGVPPAPVVHDAHRVRVRLRVHPVDDQHAPMVFLEEHRVAGKGGRRRCCRLGGSRRAPPSG